jgi:hypothetical protein
MYRSLISLMPKAQPLLLDLFPNASVAYSLRKLRTAYSGSAIRVRRSSDNTEQDIGFVGGDLDTASLLTFCGAGNGFVTTWYDQSGNANNATQATAGSQPQIVNSGSILTVNGKPNINANSKFLSANSISDSQGSVYSVSKNNSGQFIVSQANSSIATDWVMFDDAGSRVRAINQIPSPTSTNSILGNTNFNNLQKLLVHSSNALTYSLFVNSISQTLSIASGTNNGLWFNSKNYPLYIGRLNRSTAINGNTDVQEIVIFNNSANRTGIETNINSHYNIYP